MPRSAEFRSTPSRSAVGPLLGRAALFAAVALTARTALRARRELAAWHLAEERLHADWTSLNRIAGTGTMRMHGRVGAPERSTLPAVVLVHGLGMSSNYFVPLAARLARHAQVLAPDLPGHGASDHDDRPLTVPELARALGAWLDEYRVRGAILVGHSMGTQVVAELAKQRPELAAGVVLLAPTSDPATANPARMLGRMTIAMAHEKPSFLMWAAIDGRRSGPRVLAADVREALAHRIEQVLPDVRAPVRVMYGEYDRLVPRRWAEAVARVADAPPPVQVDGWGHAFNYDSPDDVVKAVFMLARGLRAAAGERPSRPATPLPRVNGGTGGAVGALPRAGDASATPRAATPPAPPHSASAGEGAPAA